MKRVFLTLAFILGIVGFASANTGANVVAGTEAVMGLSVLVGGLLGRKAMQKIEDTANAELENYEEENYEDDYDGEGDDFVDFGGDKVNFSTEARKGRSMQMTFTNNTDADHEFLMNPSFANYSYLGVPDAGVARDGAFPSILGVAGAITGAGKPRKIEHIFRCVQETPLRITGFRLATSGLNSAAAIDEMKILVKEVGLYRNLGDREITPAHFKNENTFQNNILTVPEGFDMNDQTEVLVSLKARSTATFTFIVGASLNSAKALERKANRAGKGHNKK